MTILEELPKQKVKVQFNDQYKYITEVTYYNFKHGTVRNPYDKSVAGVGYLGIGRHKLDSKNRQSIDCKAYECWSKMLKRCYTEMDGKLPSYYNVISVCDEWHNFQTFADWYEEHYYKCSDQLHLDKDIKHPNSFQYSPNNCMLIPRTINVRIRKSLHNNKIQGIEKLYNGKYRASFGRKKLGTYNTIDAAYIAYQEYKQKVIYELTEEYKNELPTDVYTVLINYKFPISLEKNYEKNKDKLTKTSLTKTFLGKIYSEKNTKSWNHAVYDIDGMSPDINNNTFFNGNRYPAIIQIKEEK